VLAYTLRNIYALAIGSLVSPFVQMVVSHLCLPGERNRLHWDREHARQLFRYGRWVFVSTLFTFLARQTDRFVLAGYLSEATFGVYNIALVGQGMCLGVVTQVVEWIAFPAYARTLNAGGDVHVHFARVSGIVQLCAGAMVAALIAGAPALIDLLYPDHYLQAGWMLRMLGLVAWFSVLEACCSSLVKALATNQWMAAGHAAKFVLLLAAIPIGWSLGGLEGALIGMIVADVGRYAVAAFGLARQGYSVFARDTATTVLLIASVLLGTRADAAAIDLPLLVRVLVVGGVATLPWLPPLAAVLLAERRRG